MPSRIISVMSSSKTVDHADYCLRLGRSLTELGASVVLVDAAFDAELTQMLGVNPEQQPGVTAMLASQEECDAEQFVLKNFALVPSDRKMLDLEEACEKLCLNIGRAMVHPLQQLSRQYTFVIIDAANHRSELSAIAAMGASDLTVLLELRPDLQGDVNTVLALFNSQLKTIRNISPEALAQKLYAGSI